MRRRRQVRVGLARPRPIPLSSGLGLPRPAGNLGMVRILHTRFVHYVLLLTVTAALTLPGLGADQPVGH